MSTTQFAPSMLSGSDGILGDRDQRLSGILPERAASCGYTRSPCFLGPGPDWETGWPCSAQGKQLQSTRAQESECGFIATCLQFLDLKGPAFPEVESSHSPQFSRNVRFTRPSVPVIVYLLTATASNFSSNHPPIDG